MIERAFERASEILAVRRATLEAGARKLLEQETLSGEEVASLLMAGTG